MKYMKLLFIPAILFLVSIIATIIGFQRSVDLEKGYISFENQTESVVYEGEYYPILGNIGYLAETLMVEAKDEYIEITMFDASNVMVKKVQLRIENDEGIHSKDQIVDVLQTTDEIDSLSDHPFSVLLEKDKEYTFLLEMMENDGEEDLDVVMVFIPEHILNMKSLMESVAFTTMIFGLITLFTTVLIVVFERNKQN